MEIHIFGEFVCDLVFWAAVFLCRHATSRNTSLVGGALRDDNNGCVGEAYLGCFLLLQKALLVSYCVVGWVLFVVFCFTLLSDRNTKKLPPSAIRTPYLQNGKYPWHGHGIAYLRNIPVSGLRFIIQP